MTAEMNKPALIRVAALPFEFSFDVQSTALVIIDMQRDFIEEGGFGASLGNDVTRLAAIVPAIAVVLAAWRAKGGLVVHTRESHLPDLSDCPPAKRLRGNPSLRIGEHGAMGRLLVRGEAGTSIIESLRPIADEIEIDKPGKGAFYRTLLHDELLTRKIEKLIFMGVTTEVCVQSSMREANDRGFDCLLLSDCTESYFPEYKEATLRMICAQGGIVGWVSESHKLLTVL
jgi:biuret amidohydrolase